MDRFLSVIHWTYWGFSGFMSLHVQASLLDGWTDVRGI